MGLAPVGSLWALQTKEPCCAREIQKDVDLDPFIRSGARKASNKIWHTQFENPHQASFQL